MGRKNMKSRSKQPDIKCRSGIFRLAGWKVNKVIPARNDFDVEKDVEYVGICLTVGVKKDGKWENVPVWLRAHQFGDLKEVVDDFAEELKRLNGAGLK